MDTSEPFGQYFGDQESNVIGASRDPGRWSCWADVIILVYSVTSMESLYCSKRMLEQVRLTGHQSVIVVGNKVDCNRMKQVTTQEAITLFAHTAASVMETSAADSQESVDLLLASAIKEHLQIQSSNSLNTKSPEEISHLMIPTPTLNRKLTGSRKRKESYWSKITFLPKHSI